MTKQCQALGGIEQFGATRLREKTNFLFTQKAGGLFDAGCIGGEGFGDGCIFAEERG
jgi:hypothetical protein